MASSFAIEVPGEANPLTENLLIHALRAASSSDPHQIQTGTKQLQEWEKVAQYYVHLQSAYLDRRLPVETRYLAVIQLKNGIEKYWRKTALNAVSKEDKAVIRQRLVDGTIGESDNRLALQSSLVVAKIARFEFPNDWPEALSEILERLRHAIQYSDPRTTSRSLLLLLHITKELSTGRLQRTKQNLQSATPELVHVAGQYYASNIHRITRVLTQEPSHDLSQDLQCALLAIKLVRRLLVSGYEYPNREQDVINFWSISIASLGELIDLTRPHRLLPPISILLEKHMLQLSKLHHEMAKDHPAAFVLLPDSINLIFSYWSVIKEVGESYGSKEAVPLAIHNANPGSGGDTNERTSIDKFALRGMLVIRACIRMVHSPAHTFKTRKPEDREEQKQAANIIRDDILTEQFVREVMETIVTKFFVFRASDLQEWENEPEEWEKREEAEGEDWEFSIRPCAEKLFLDLAINYKEMIVQPLLQVFQSVAAPGNEDILSKDSIYTAVGLAAPVLQEHLDFDAFIRDTLVVEVQKTIPGFNILRRRIAIVIGQWITIKVSNELKPTVYQIFQHLLIKEGQPLNDQVVRVTAARQFKNVVDDWNFVPDLFMSHAEPILTSIMHLIHEVELVETKMALLNTISLIVERLEHHISPFAEQILSLLPSLWEGSGEEHLMKQAILTILARLVNAMKADSLPFHSMVIPIIRGAVTPDSDSQVYLLEDALELWGNIISQTPTDSASQELLDLSSNLFTIFELGSHSLRKALEIAESYMLLAPAHMLSDNMRKQTLLSLNSLIGTLRPDANGLVFTLLEATIRAAERLGGKPAVDQLLCDMHESGVMHKLIEGLHGSWRAHSKTGPLAQTPPVDGVVETDYFAVLARLILATADTSCQAIGAAVNVDGDAADNTMEWLLAEWFDHFENIGDPSRRKLMCLAITKLLETNQAWILVNLQLLMNMWTDLMREIYEEGQDLTGADSLVKADEHVANGAPEAPEDTRRRAMTMSDPVHTVSMADWIKHYLKGAIASQPSFQEEWLVNVDREVLNGFSALGIM